MEKNYLQLKYAHLAPKLTSNDLGQTNSSKDKDLEKEKDIKWVGRCASEPLYLVVKKQISSPMMDSHSQDPTFIWTLPFDALQENETLIKAAGRIVSRSLGSDVRHFDIESGPVALYKFRYQGNKHLADPSCCGEKVFFHHLIYLGSNLNLNPSSQSKAESVDGNIVDYAWLKLSELPDYLTEDIYNFAIKVIPSY